MEIFLSWSGAISKKVAELLKTWLPRVNQKLAYPYLSAHDIEPGERWAENLEKRLRQSNYGIICLTPDNLKAEWILFEAGSLSKHYEEARITSLLLANLRPAEVPPPLSRFQNIQPDKEGMHSLVKGINLRLGESSVDPAILDESFEGLWDKFDKSYQKIIAVPTSNNSGPVRNDRELLEELVQLARYNNNLIRKLSDILQRHLPVIPTIDYSEIDTPGDYLEKSDDLRRLVSVYLKIKSIELSGTAKNKREEIEKYLAEWNAIIASMKAHETEVKKPEANDDN